MAKTDKKTKGGGMDGLNIQINQIITMKKQHPCGGAEWKIVRAGADVQLQCLTCGKYIRLTRDDVKKRAKSARCGE